MKMNQIFLNITGRINRRTLYVVGDGIYMNYDDAVKAASNGTTITIDGEEFYFIDTICDDYRAKKTIVKAKNHGLGWNKVKE